MPFSDAALHPGIRKKECWRNVYRSQYFTKAGVFSPEWFGDISPVLSGERLCVVWLISSVPRKYFIVWFPDTVDRQSWGARAVRWWEHSPPTKNNVARVRILALTLVGWVCCLFSPFLREVFLRFSSLLKNHHFLDTRARFSEFLRTPKDSKCKFTIYKLTICTRDTTQLFGWAVTRTFCMLLFSVTVQHFTDG